jgi:aryl-alcohol dehydrogenase-like predicted oxidoreductase
MTVKYNMIASLKRQVSKITFGCWELGGGAWEKESDEANLKVIEEALKLGINSFDTAEGYGNGHSEEVVGLALEKRRQDVVIASKVSPSHLRASDVRQSIENSLKRLRTEYLDIYYVHWPNADIPVHETMVEFRRLREEGLIRAVAVSNFSRAQLEEAEEVTKVDFIQNEYSLLHRSLEDEVIPYCIEHDIAIMTYSSIAKGILTGVYHLGDTPRKLADDDFRKTRRLFLPHHLEKETELVHAVKEVAEAHNVMPSEIAISWLLHQTGVTSAIVGTQNAEHLKQNVRAVDIELTEAQIHRLDEVSRRTLTAIDG